MFVVIVGKKGFLEKTWLVVQLVVLQSLCLTSFNIKNGIFWISDWKHQTDLALTTFKVPHRRNVKKLRVIYSFFTHGDNKIFIEECYAWTHFADAWTRVLPTRTQYLHLKRSFPRRPLQAFHAIFYSLQRRLAVYATNLFPDIKMSWFTINHD